MHALLVSDQPKLMTQISSKLMDCGFLVLGVNSVDAAEQFLRDTSVDLLVMEEKVSGRLTHSLSLLAEYRVSTSSTVIVTERQGDDLDELFELLPGLSCVFGKGIPADFVAQMALASTSGRAIKGKLSSKAMARPALSKPEMEELADAVVAESKVEEPVADVLAAQEPVEETVETQDIAATHRAAKDRIAARAAAFARAKEASEGAAPIPGFLRSNDAAVPGLTAAEIAENAETRPRFVLDPAKLDAAEAEIARQAS